MPYRFSYYLSFFNLFSYNAHSNVRIRHWNRTTRTAGSEFHQKWQCIKKVKKPGMQHVLCVWVAINKGIKCKR
jgi:hypothetical protein